MFVIKDPVFILYGSVKVRDSVFRDVDWEITVGIFHPIQHTANSFRSNFEPRWPRSKTIRSSYEWKIYIIYHCIIRAKMYFICISMMYKRTYCATLPEPRRVFRGVDILVPVVTLVYIINGWNQVWRIKIHA